MLRMQRPHSSGVPATVDVRVAATFGREGTCCQTRMKNGAHVTSNNEHPGQSVT